MVKDRDRGWAIVSVWVRFRVGVWIRFRVGVWVRCRVGVWVRFRVRVEAIRVGIEVRVMAKAMVVSVIW